MEKLYHKTSSKYSPTSKEKYINYRFLPVLLACPKGPHVYGIILPLGLRDSPPLFLIVFRILRIKHSADTLILMPRLLLGGMSETEIIEHQKARGLQKK